ncbi:hypothetical protein AKJ16_DCAP06615, partial [Drosera capensis]
MLWKYMANARSTLSSMRSLLSGMLHAMWHNRSNAVAPTFGSRKTSWTRYLTTPASTIVLIAYGLDAREEASFTASSSTDLPAALRAKTSSPHLLNADL